ncbi:MAG: hypothetical protein AB9861_02365 [Methanosarcina sp.]
MNSSEDRPDKHTEIVTGFAQKIAVKAKDGYQEPYQGPYLPWSPSGKRAKLFSGSCSRRKKAGAVSRSGS